MRYLIIVPAFNEETNIEDVIKNIMNEMTCDIVVVNDGSVDHTSEILKAMADKYSHVYNIDLPFNLGIGGAVQTGYIYAWRNDYDIAVQMDGDGQHSPRFLKELLMPIEAGEADMVIGSRFLKKEGFQSSFMRRVGIRYFRWLTRCLVGGDIHDMTSGYRAINRDIIGLFARNYPIDYPEPETNERLLRLGYRVREVPVIMNARKGGVSSISFFSSAWYMVKVTLAILIDFFGRASEEEDGI